MARGAAGRAVVSVTLAAIEKAVSSPAARSVVVNAIAMGVAFVNQVLLARIMGIEEFGLYMLALAWLNTLVLVGKLGYDTAALRFISQYLAGNDRDAVERFAGHAVRRTAFASLFVTLVALVTVYLLKLWGLMSAETAEVFALMSFIVPIFAFTLTLAGFLQARGKIVLAQGLPNIFRPLLIVVIASGVLWATGTVSSRAAMTMTLVAAIVVMGALWIAARQRIGGAGQVDVASRKAWDAAALSFTVTTSLTLLLNQSDLQILGAFVPSDQVGTYAAAARLALLVPFPTNAANSGVAPEVARLHALGDSAGIRELIRSASIWTLATSSMLAAVLLIGGEHLLGLFGEEFRDGMSLLAILVLARWLLAVTGLGGHLLNMTGHHARGTQVVAIAAIVQVLACAALVPMFGAYGAAASVVAGALVWSVLTVHGCRRLLGLSPLVLKI